MLAHDRILTAVDIRLLESSNFHAVFKQTSAHQLNEALTKHDIRIGVTHLYGCDDYKDTEKHRYTGRRK